MKTRVATGLVIASVYFLVLAATIYIKAPVGRVIYDIMVVAMMVVGGIEMSKAISKKFSRPIIWFVILNSVLGYAAFMFVNSSTAWGGVDSGGITAFFGQLIFVFLLCMIYNMYKKNDISNVFSTMFVLVYPVSMMVYMLALNYLDDQYRVVAILLVFSISSFTDVAAYFVGSIVGGKKLAPNISPKKTISGAVGGMIGGVLAALMVFAFGQAGILRVQLFGDNWAQNVNHLLIIGIVGAFLNTFGDLIASFIKRACGTKDYGSIMPGHGGIIDRVDGMMLVAVFVFLYITVFDMMSVVIV